MTSLQTIQTTSTTERYFEEDVVVGVLLSDELLLVDVADDADDSVFVESPAAFSPFEVSPDPLSPLPFSVPAVSFESGGFDLLE